MRKIGFIASAFVTVSLLLALLASQLLFPQQLFGHRLSLLGLAVLGSIATVIFARQ